MNYLRLCPLCQVKKTSPPFLSFSTKAFQVGIILLLHRSCASSSFPTYKCLDVYQCISSCFVLCVLFIFLLERRPRGINVGLRKLVEVSYGS